MVKAQVRLAGASRSNPDWHRDEAILVLDLYINGFGKRLPSKKTDERVIAMSNVLRQLPIHVPASRADNFRNPDGIYLKLGNFRSIDPSTDRKVTDHGARVDRQVWDEFAHDPGQLRLEAQAILRRYGLGGHDTATEGSEPREIDYWAFLANPDVYRIEDAVRELEVETWTTKRSDVAKGDRVLIWKAKGHDRDRGLIALGEVLTDPVPMSGASPYWVDPEAGRTIEDRVQVRFVVPPELPLWIDGPADALLRDLSVSRATGGTVFHVTPEQWNAVVEAAGGWPQFGSEVAEAQAVIEDLAGARAQRQGFQVDPATRRAVEQYAMDRAIQYWREQGWQVEDVSPTESYDLRCTRAGQEELRVEVKGTVTNGAEVLLTPNEVEHARTQYPHIALFVVSNVEVTTPSSGAPGVQGGITRVWAPWTISEGRLTAVGYSYAPPKAE